MFDFGRNRTYCLNHSITGSKRSTLADDGDVKTGQSGLVLLGSRSWYNDDNRGKIDFRIVQLIDYTKQRWFAEQGHQRLMGVDPL